MAAARTASITLVSAAYQAPVPLRAVGHVLIEPAIKQQQLDLSENVCWI